MSENRTPDEMGDDLLKGLGYETQEGMPQDKPRGTAWGVISFSREDIDRHSVYISENSLPLPPAQMPRIILVDAKGQRWSTRWDAGKLIVDARLDE